VRGGLAVAIHDVEPATFERAALLRDWLADLGVDRATLLVIPAPDLHPFSSRRPELADWLVQRARAGDAVAQHGLRHGPEFAGLDEEEARRAVESGRRLLRLAGVEPRGFVAPGYAYTPALERALAGRFEWWAGLLGLQRGGGARRGVQQSSDRVIDPKRARLTTRYTILHRRPASATSS
jgi:predicted deacetylase